MFTKPALIPIVGPFAERSRNIPKHKKRIETLLNTKAFINLSSICLVLHVLFIYFFENFHIYLYEMRRHDFKGFDGSFEPRVVSLQR